jgi:hypothetical protein
VRRTPSVKTRVITWSGMPSKSRPTGVATRCLAKAPRPQRQDHAFAQLGACKAPRPRLERGTYRLGEGLPPSGSFETANRVSPLCLHIGWSGLTKPFCSGAAVCRVMPYRLWITCGDHTQGPGLVGILWERTPQTKAFLRSQDEPLSRSPHADCRPSAANLHRCRRGFGPPTPVLR